MSKNVKETHANQSILTCFTLSERKDSQSFKNSNNGRITTEQRRTSA